MYPRLLTHDRTGMRIRVDSWEAQSSLGPGWRDENPAEDISVASPPAPDSVETAARRRGRPPKVK